MPCNFRFAPRRLHGFVAASLCVIAAAASAAHATSPGIVSPIKTIYLMQMAHLDIGFTKPPDLLANDEKTVIDSGNIR